MAGGAEYLQRVAILAQQRDRASQAADCGDALRDDYIGDLRGRERLGERIGDGLQVCAAIGSLFALGDIDTRATVAGELCIWREAWHTIIQHPAVQTIGAPEPIFDCERQAMLEVRAVDRHAA